MVMANVRDPDLLALVASDRIRHATSIEIGPRAYAASIPENAVPFMLPLIWAEWERTFRTLHEEAR
jgi:hypothetical protein